MPMATDAVAFGCTCGALTGRIAPATPRSGTHLECFCNDCRAAQIHLGQPDPAPGGVAIFQTTPDAVTIVSGRNRLGVMRLGPRGLLRWYATCCNAPLFNTLARPTLPFVGVLVDRLADPGRIGPVLAQSFVPNPAGGAPRHKGAMRMTWRFLIRLAAARLSGRWRHTPFFDLATGAPVVAPRVLDKAERNRASAR